LFTQLALHLREAGFKCLSLGMAPLSGLKPAPLASIRHRIGHLLWSYGGQLYSFRGLRSFKGKFHPVWEPRYLATSGLLGPFLTLAAVATARPSPGEPDPS
jgi:phosphatidylglycerol lysyltransferase